MEGIEIIRATLRKPAMLGYDGNILGMIARDTAREIVRAEMLYHAYRLIDWASGNADNGFRPK